MILGRHIKYLRVEPRIRYVIDLVPVWLTTNTDPYSISDSIRQQIFFKVIGISQGSLESEEDLRIFFKNNRCSCPCMTILVVFHTDSRHNYIIAKAITSNAPLM